MAIEIKFGTGEDLDVPLPTPQKQRILTEYLGLPEDLHNKAVLELFSGDKDSSFKPEVVDRSGPKKVASNYVGVDLNQNTGVEHMTGDVYQVVDELPSQSFDYVIMKGPPIWCIVKQKDDWARLTGGQTMTLALADPEEFTKFLGKCSRLIIPKRGNKISVAQGFSPQDIDAIWRHAPASIPNYHEWTIGSIPTGEQSKIYFCKKGKRVETLEYEDQALQLIHL